MKPRLAWHKTSVGRICCFLGSIKPAIPVLTLVAFAMAWATFIESRENGPVARELVYGSWWFMGLTIWICLALIFAVVVRYPWTKKHTGFIIVHAGLITTIVGGFMSLYGRIEGTMTLKEGTASNIIERPIREFEMLEIPGAGAMESVAKMTLSAIDDRNRGRILPVEDMTISIVEHWKNATVEQTILDDAARPMEAIEFSTTLNAAQGMVLPETTFDEPRATVGKIQLRVLAANTDWSPTPPDAASEDGDDSTNLDESPSNETDPATNTEETAEERLYFLDTSNSELGIPGVGNTIIDNWKVVQKQTFMHAQVGEGGGLVEGDITQNNPALQVVLEHITDGSQERHIAFARFPDVEMMRPIVPGDSASGLRLRYSNPDALKEISPPADIEHEHEDYDRLVFQHNDGTLKATLVRIDGTTTVFDLEAVKDGPIEIDLDGQPFYVLRHYSHARAGEKFTKARESKTSNLPVLLVEVAEGYETQTVQLAWKTPTPVFSEGGGRPVFLRYGPTEYEIPFNIQLDDFRKNDYPGSTMAMEFESDVTWQPVHVHVEGDDHANLPDPKTQKIWMNNPLKFDGWKVYQAGFQGDQISTFSIMNDPGLSMTYLGCIVLCLGILVIFYSRDLSHGHPGVSTGGRKSAGNKGETA